MSSDLSFAGSIEHDLTLGKLWLCKNLPRQKYNNVYVLGSWYGNIGLIMRYLGIHFDHITNIDGNQKYCAATKQIYKLANFDRPYKILNADCNKVDYSAADLVINTSTNDIKIDSWFDRIPTHCMVALQSRNNQAPVSIGEEPVNFSRFLRSYPLDITLYSGKMRLSNRQESYDRYMLIGYK